MSSNCIIENVYESENLFIEPHRYRCDADEVNNYIQHSWSISKGILNYVGEWHTHDCEHPVPSNVDNDTIKKILKRDKDLVNIYLFVIGKKSMYIGQITQINKKLIEVGRLSYDEKND